MFNPNDSPFNLDDIANQLITDGLEFLPDDATEVEEMVANCYDTNLSLDEANYVLGILETLEDEIDYNAELADEEEEYQFETELLPEFLTDLLEDEDDE